MCRPAGARGFSRPGVLVICRPDGAGCSGESEIRVLNEIRCLTSSRPSPEEKGQNYPDDITPSPLESLPAEVGVGVRCRLLRGCFVARVMRN
jgi:hypothetical protein